MLDNSKHRKGIEYSHRTRSLHKQAVPRIAHNDGCVIVQGSFEMVSLLFVMKVESFSVR